MSMPSAVDISWTVPNDIRLEVKNLWVRRGGKFILADISFSADPGKFVGIVGPNGAGKTTLLRAIAGERPTFGQVLLNGDNLYDSPEFWLRQLGYVPVDNVLHDQLTVWQALTFAGRLRLPYESEQDIARKTDLLLTEFGFPLGDRRRNTLMSKLSSGERKRVNICAELYMEPRLLLLDEPTSNLDPDAELDLMRKLRERAHRHNQTILVVTHTLNTVGECDQVIFVENATIKAIGNPTTVLENLKQDLGEERQHLSPYYGWSAVFDHFKTDDQRREKLVEEKTQQQVNVLPVTSNTPTTQPTPVTATPFWKQLALLLRRYFLIRANERGVLILTLALGFIGGTLFFVLPPEAFVRPEDPGDVTKIVAARQSSFILALVVALIGLISGFREISKEFRIYQHERLKGLLPSAYVLSKWIWLTVAVGIIAPLALLAMLSFVYNQPLPSLPLPTTSVVLLSAITLILACIAALTLGLSLSALANLGALSPTVTNNDNRATIYLALAVVFHVLLSGLVKNPAFEEAINFLSTFATSHWAVEGFSSSLSFYCWASIKRLDEFNSIGHIASVWLSLAVYILGAIILAVVALRLKDPWATTRGLIGSARAQASTILILVCVLALLVSWANFLLQPSNQYFSLAFSDTFYGGLRFPRIEYVKQPNLLQMLVGYVSQSPCGEIGE